MEALTRGGAVAWRRYPPLFAVVLAVVLAIFTLPSALNLPQANPGQVAEYAPVTGRSNAPPAGSFAALGLGGGGAAESGLGGASGTLGGALTTPTAFDCVGNPPRQTEDPLSPPCVPSFSGDNGGATYQGVSANEVRVVFYFDCCTNYASTTEGTETSPTDAWYDLGAPPQSSDPLFVRVARFMQTYFNARYQTYRRRVHFWAFYGRCVDDQLGNCGATPDTRRADASDVYRSVHPFAVMDFATGYHDVFADAVAQYGITHFGNTALGPGAFAGEPESFFQAHPGLIWGFDPSLEQQAALVSSFICRKAVPNPVSFSGNASDAGKPRKFGLLETDDPTFPDLHRYAELIRQEVQACGGDLPDVGTFPSACCAISIDYDAAAANMAQFKRDQVTTVIFGGGLENQDTQVAASLQYFPEWIAAGDHGMDSNGNGALAQAPSEWQHAWVVTNEPLTPALKYTRCYQAWSEVGNPPPPSFADAQFGCVMYNDVRELFIGIQVAGPRLTPGAMDKGFHAIPQVASGDPTVPACFYEPGDYNCVKDNVAEWWDPRSRDANGNAGCWRMPLGGKRYLVNTWAAGNVDAQRSAGDPCNSY